MLVSIYLVYRLVKKAIKTILRHKRNKSEYTDKEQSEVIKNTNNNTNNKNNSIDKIMLGKPVKPEVKKKIEKNDLGWSRLVKFLGAIVKTAVIVIFMSLIYDEVNNINLADKVHEDVGINGYVLECSNLLGDGFCIVEESETGEIFTVIFYEDGSHKVKEGKINFGINDKNNVNKKERK